MAPMDQNKRNVATFDSTLHIRANSERLKAGARILREGSMFHYIRRPWVSNDRV
jgi:hypothetical protein